MSEEPPLVRVAHALLRAAVGDGAAEVRLLPVARAAGGWSPLRVQCLAEGAWRDLPSMPQLPGVISGNITRRFQVLAGVNPFSSKGPQEGCFRFRDEVEGQMGREYLIHASFPKGPEGITTVLTIEDETTSLDRGISP